MICPQCHAENPDTNRFCTKCGARLTGAPAAAAASPAAPATEPRPAVPVPAAAAPPHRHFARTGIVLLISGGVVVLIVLLLLVVGVVLAITNANHRATTAGGVRPAVGQPGQPSGGGGVPSSPAPAVPAPPSAGGPAPAPAVPPPPGAGAPAPAPAPAVPPPPGPGAPAPAPTVPPPPAAPPSAPPSAPAPAVPAPPARPAPAPQQPGPRRIAMTRYRASDGRWSILAPQSWHVTQSSNGSLIVFYYDDPNDGTAFVLIPFQQLQGEMTAKDVLVLIARSIQQHSPDLQVRINSVRDLSQGAMAAQALDADAAWTGGRGQAMRGHLNLIAFSQRGSGSTTFIFFGGQAPADAFPNAAPVFDVMVKSFSARHE